MRVCAESRLDDERMQNTGGRDAQRLRFTESNQRVPEE